ncbi:MAG: DUF2249 domain-containing protein [Bryobacterales bacterium]|nr:DUF2249 domain-containing protein [Bryobacterales bacterium]
MPNEVLDLRPLPPPQRHGLVFATFDALKLNDSFILINDHDPNPLRMQMDFMRHGEMGWEYLERGPVDFRIQVTRIAEPKKPKSAAEKSA